MSYFDKVFKPELVFILTGDAFLHLIPHAILAKGGDDDGHSHSHSHSHDKVEQDPHDFHGHDLSVGVWVLVGIITFLVVEKLIRIMKGGHGHSHSHSAPVPKAVEPEQETTKNGDTKATKKKGKDSKEATDKTGKSAKSAAVVSKKGIKMLFIDNLYYFNSKLTFLSISEKKNPPPQEDIKVAGYLNLAADFTHNFTDGLAIGASFLAGRSVGIVTTFTILMHEGQKQTIL